MMHNIPTLEVLMRRRSSPMGRVLLPPTRMLGKRSALGGMLGGLLGLLGGCSSADVTFAPATDPHQLLLSVRLPVHAFNLATQAPYDTVTMPVAAQLGDGTPAPATLQYTARDTLLTVSASGVVRAIHPGTVWLVVSARYNGVTQSDSAVISIVDGAPSGVKSIGVRPLPGDSAVVGVQYPCWYFVECTRKLFVLSATDSSNAVNGSVVIDAWSGDPSIATLSKGSGEALAQGIKAGGTWLYAATYAYGAYFTDSVLFTVRPLRVFSVVAAPKLKLVDSVLVEVMEFSPKELHVPRGSDVQWQSPQPSYFGADTLGPAVRIVFDDSTAPEASSFFDPRPGCNIFYIAFCNDHGGAGNMVVQAAVLNNGNDFYSGREVRRFNRPGRYPYHNTQHGTGAIVVE